MELFDYYTRASVECGSREDLQVGPLFLPGKGITFFSFSFTYYLN